MNKIKNIYHKYQEIINYLIIGVLTTLISIVTYYICVHTFLSSNNAIQLQIANIISWIVSVLFAYVTNRTIVFKSHSSKYLQEIISFFGTRLLTLILDMGIMFLLVTICSINDTIGKIISQILVIIANYIFSKFFVFKSK